MTRSKTTSRKTHSVRISGTIGRPFDCCCSDTPFAADEGSKKVNNHQLRRPRQLESACCIPDTAFPTNCTYSVLRIRLALVPEWFASTKRMTMGIGL